MKIALVTDRPILALGLSQLLARKGVEYAGSAPVSLLCPIDVDLDGSRLILLDIGDSMGIQDLIALRKRTKTDILLWAHGLPTEVALQAVATGIRGILPQTANEDTTIECLRAVARGAFWFEKDLTNKFLLSKSIRLTPREATIAQLIAQGLKNKEIASILSLSEGTIKVYLSKLFDKVGVADRFQLALFTQKNIVLSGSGGAIIQGQIPPPLRSLYIAHHPDLPAALASGRSTPPVA